MTVLLYVGSPLSDCPPLCCSRTASEVSKEEGSYASRFYRWFLESIKSCLLLLVALPGLIDTLAQLLAWRSLLWLSMTWRRRYSTQSNFFSTTSLAWSLALYLLFYFSQEKPLRGKEIHPPTHTHTHRHTHRQTHTQTHTNIHIHTHIHIRTHTHTLALNRTKYKKGFFQSHTFKKLLWAEWLMHTKIWHLLNLTRNPWFDQFTNNSKGFFTSYLSKFTATSDDMIKAYISEITF